MRRLEREEREFSNMEWTIYREGGEKERRAERDRIEEKEMAMDIFLRL